MRLSNGARQNSVITTLDYQTESKCGVESIGYRANVVAPGTPTGVPKVLPTCREYNGMYWYKTTDLGQWMRTTQPFLSKILLCGVRPSHRLPDSTEEYYTAEEFRIMCWLVTEIPYWRSGCRLIHPYRFAWEFEPYQKVCDNIHNGERIPPRYTAPGFDILFYYDETTSL